MKVQSTRTFSTALSSALTLVISLSTLSTAYADDFDSICGGTTPPTGQKGSYCSAAKQSKDVAKKEKTLTLVYSAAAGTCAAACAATLASMGAAAAVSKACNIGALGAAATDVVMTQNFASAFMTAMTSGMSLMQGSAGNFSLMGHDTGIPNPCITAATSTASAVMHNSSKKSAEATEQSSLASAKSVNDSSNDPYGYNGTLTGSTPGGNTSLASTSSTATIVKPGSDSSDTAANGACGGDTSTAAGAANCAATADPKVAGMLTDPEFQKAFEKSSGMKLDDYLKNGGSVSPSNAIQAAAGSALSGDASVPLGKAIAAVEQAVPDFNQPINNAYASGGGGKKDSGDAEFNSMMSGLMSKLNPKSEQEKKSGVSEVKFGGAVRNLASVTAEDTTVSLFERVAFRYSHVTPRLLNDPAQRTLSDWATQGSAASKGGSPSAIAPQIKRN